MNIAASPAVSVIINCYNGDKFLKHAIDSVYAQTFDDWEIVFWDNASTDSSAKIAQSYDRRLKYFLAPQTTTLGAARNLALQQARGRYVAFLDCDDLYLPFKLSSQVALMDQGGYALSYGGALIINEAGNFVRSATVCNCSGNIFGNLLRHYEINMPSVMIRRSLILNEGLGFDASMKYCPDYNLFMEIASRHPVGVIKNSIVKYRVVTNSLSRQTVNIASSEIRSSLDRILAANPYLETQYRSDIRRAYDKLRYYDAVSEIYSANHSAARKHLAPIIFRRLVFFLIYILLYMPLPSSLILRFLRR